MSEQRPKDHRLVSHRLECAVQIGQKCNCGLEQESSKPKLTCTESHAIQPSALEYVAGLEAEIERLRACKTQLENVLLYNALKDSFTILEANIKEALAATGRDHFDKELPADETSPVLSTTTTAHPHPHDCHGLKSWLAPGMVCANCGYEYK